MIKKNIMKRDRTKYKTTYTSHLGLKKKKKKVKVKNTRKQMSRKKRIIRENKM